MQIMMRDIFSKYHWVTLSDDQVIEFGERIRQLRADGEPWYMVRSVMGMSVRTAKMVACLR